MRNQDVNPKLSAKPRLVRIRCRRTGQDLAVDEHRKCPYCLGRADDMANGQHQRFCDFVPSLDPLHFGFPPGTVRDLDG